MSAFKNKLEKYKDGKKSIYFSIFFGNFFIKHQKFFKRIFNSVTIPVFLSIILIAIFSQKQTLLVSFYSSIITVLQFILVSLLSLVFAKLFSIKVIKNITIIFTILLIINIFLIFINIDLAEKMFILAGFYKIALFLLFSFLLYKTLSFIMPSLESGIFLFIKNIIEIRNLFNIYYIIIVLTNIFYLVLSFIIYNVHLLNIALDGFFLLLIDLILTSIAKTFSNLINIKLSNNNLFEYYDNDFDTITEEKQNELLTNFSNSGKNIRQTILAILILIALKILFVYYFM
ncbi:MAG TPA: hypothetical protein VLL98_02755 [Rickettsiales bacterium]|nr:hypothetical protein [Rickettsiales bacterium]